MKISVIWDVTLYDSEEPVASIFSVKKDSSALKMDMCMLYYISKILWYVDPFPSNSCVIQETAQQPLLGNSSVDTFPQERENTQ
jgi:hypothetical protein